MVKDYLSVRESARAFTVLKGVMAIAPILAPILGAYLSERFGWRASFDCLALFCFALLLLAWVSLPETLLVENRTKITFWRTFERYKNVISNRVFLKYATCVMATQGVLFGFFSISPHLIVDKLGYSQAEFSLCFGLNAFSYMVASVVSTYTLGIYGSRFNILSGGLLIGLGGLLIMAGVAIWGLSLPILLTGALTASAGVSFAAGAAIGEALKPFEHSIGVATALLGCYEFIFGGFIGDYMVSLGTQSATPFAMTLCLMGLFVLQATRQGRSSHLPSVTTIS
jgi:MFS family permease